MSPTSVDPLLPAPAVPPPPAAPATDKLKLSDFGDWISPMIVKELRQGLRTRTFAAVFISWQAFLVLCLIISTASSNSGGSNFFFWGVIMVLFVPILPMRGLTSLSGEIKDGTLDLLQLTRLGAWRITFGKWAALVSQAGLIGISILPYIVMRYFAGGVSVAWEIWGLGVFVLAAAVLTAINVGLSALRSVILRGLLFLALMAVALPMGGMLVARLAENEIADLVDADSGFWAGMGIVSGIAVYLTVFFLNLGVSQIATVAENHSTLKRVIALTLTLGLGLALQLTTRRYEDFLQVAMLVALALTGIDCLSDRPTTSPTVLTPFAKRGVLGRLMGMLFAPGWHTGSIFWIGLVLSAALVTAGKMDVADFMKHGDPGWDVVKAIMVFFTTVGTLLLPACVAVWMTRHRDGDSLLGALFSCLIASLLVSVVFAIIGTEMASSEGWMAVFPALLPFSALIAAEDHAFRSAQFIYALPAAMTIVSLTILWIVGRPYFRALWTTPPSVDGAARKAADA